MNVNKKNQAVVLALAITLISGFSVTAHAEDNLQSDTYQIEEAENQENIQYEENELTAQEETVSQDTNEVSTLSNESSNEVQNLSGGGYKTQADDGIVIDKTNRTVTCNNSIDVTLTQKDVATNAGNERVYALDVPAEVRNQTSSYRFNWTVIYNAPVNITFDNIDAEAAWILPSAAEGGFQIFQFNDAVTVNVNASTINEMDAYSNYLSVSSLFGTEKQLTLSIKKKLTYNIVNSKINAFTGGFSKTGSFPGNGFPPVKIDSNCSLDGGIEINLSNKSSVNTLYAGHYFYVNEVKESANQVFTCKGIDVTADDSTIGGLVASFAKNGKADRTKDIEIDGDFNVSLKNGSSLKMLISNGAVFGGGQNISGNVTGKTTLTTDTEMSMVQMLNVDVVNLGAPLAVKPASAGTGANLTLPTNGMEVNFVDEDAWKNKDVAFAYQYTDGTYPAVDDSKIKFNWTKDTLELKYNKDTNTSTQQWQLFKTKAKVEYVTNNDDTLAPDLVPVGTKVNEPTVTKKGHQFEGWYTTEDFQDGTEFDFNQTIDDDVKLYAKWSVTDMTVKLEPNDGSKMNDVKVPYGSAMNEPTLGNREGYTFDGWYTSKDFQEDTKWDFNKAVEDDLTLYAKWNQKEYTVKVETNGGSAVDDMKVLYGKTIKEPTSSKEGYTLEGWYTDKDLTKKWNFKDGVKEDLTLYAKWVENKTPEKPSDPVKPSDDDKKPTDDTQKPSDNDKNPSADINKGNETNDKENVEKPTVSKNTSSTNQDVNKTQTTKETKKKSPKTGDTTPIVSSFMMMGVGLLSMIGILRKKEHK